MKTCAYFCLVIFVYVQHQANIGMEIFVVRNNSFPFLENNLTTKIKLPKFSIMEYVIHLYHVTIRNF